MRRALSSGFVVALGLLAGHAALGQSGSDDSAGERDQPIVAPEGLDDTPVLLLADEVTYDRDLGVAVARGNVEVSQNDRVVLADTLTYNERTQTVTASGRVALLEPTGEVLFADHAELTDDMREAVINNVGLLLAKHTRVAAASAVRTGGNRTVLNNAVFSPCQLCPEDPTAAPIWQLKAVRIVHDQEEQVVEYRDAWLEIYGVPVAYTPYLFHPDPTVDRKSGFLIPSFGQSSELGWFLDLPYYWVIDEDKDLLVRPKFTTEQSVALFGEYRQRLVDGEVRIAGSGTIADREVIRDSGRTTEEDVLRGHLDAEGEFNIDKNWRWGFIARRTTDKTYLRLYDISSPSTLTSRIYAEGFHGRSYALAEALAFQGLRTEDDDEESPLIHPVAQYDFLGEPDAWGGYFNANANLLALTREEGRDVRRLHLKGGYHLPYISDAGHLLTLDASLVADGYWVDQVDPESDAVNPAGDTFSGFEGRIFPQVYGEWHYPLVRRYASASEIFEPIAALVLAPPGSNPDKIPNEDSLEFEFDETHLGDPDRFTGLDRVDSGGRLDYGVKWSVLGDSGGYTSIMLGQSFRLYGGNEFPEDSGLEQDLSDVVGRIEVRPRYDLNLNYRFRFDTEEMELERSELRLQAGPPVLNLAVTYAMAAGGESDEDSVEQISGTLRSQLSDYWSIFAQTQYDIAGDSRLADSAGITYSDECFTLNFTASRELFEDEELEPETTFKLSVGFKYLGSVDL
jgi:LPS-assembly protein